MFNRKKEDKENKEGLYSDLFKNMKYNASKVGFDTIKGYVLGSMVGVFTPTHYSLSKSMHRSGVTFAKMSAAYSTTDIIVKNIRKKDDFFNSFLAGSIAGAVGVQRNRILGSVIFGGFSGISEYLTNDTDEE